MALIIFLDGLLAKSVILKNWALSELDKSKPYYTDLLALPHSRIIRAVHLKPKKVMSGPDIDDICLIWLRCYKRPFKATVCGQAISINSAFLVFFMPNKGMQ